MLRDPPCRYSVDQNLDSGFWILCFHFTREETEL